MTLVKQLVRKFLDLKHICWQPKPSQSRMSVFKYRSFSSPQIFENSLKIVRDKSIWFAEPNSLNDPYEYSTKSSFGKLTTAEKANFWIKRGMPHLQTLNEAQKANYIKNIEALLENPLEALKNNGTQGIFSCSKTWENLVMWSHYSDCHRGVVIEIETDGVEILNRSFEVIYDDRPSVYQIYKDHHVDDILKMASTKYLDWAYEKEIRFFCSSGAHNIPADSIKSITFGLNSRRGNFNQFCEFYNAIRIGLPNCKIFEVLPSNTYKIERKELDRSIPCYPMQT